MLIQRRAFSAPFPLGSDQERGQPCHHVSQGADSGGFRGERLNTGVTKVEGSLGTGKVSREVGGKVGEVRATASQSQG